MLTAVNTKRKSIWEEIQMKMNNYAKLTATDKTDKNGVNVKTSMEITM